MAKGIMVIRNFMIENISDKHNEEINEWIFFELFS